MNRRKLLILGSTAIARPLAVRAQQPGKVYRIALMRLAVPELLLAQADEVIE
jgi:hypothetical protein